MNEDGKKDDCIVIGGKKAKFIDPLSDWGFKKLFGTEANKEILLEFLRDLFPDKRIEDIAYLNNENQGLSESDRKSVFDVVCRTVAGDRFIVEVQKKDQRYFMERSLYYSTFPVDEFYAYIVPAGKMLRKSFRAVDGTVLPACAPEREHQVREAAADISLHMSVRKREHGRKEQGRLSPFLEKFLHLRVQAGLVRVFWIFAGIVHAPAVEHVSASVS